MKVVSNDCSYIIALNYIWFGDDQVIISRKSSKPWLESNCTK